MQFFKMLPVLVLASATTAQAEVFVNTFVSTTMSNPLGNTCNFFCLSPHSPSLILGGENPRTWIAVTANDSVTYSWGAGNGASGLLNIYLISNGADETGEVYGLTSGSWLKLGNLFEGYLGDLGTPNIRTSFAIPSSITQVRVVSFTNNGYSPGLDLTGISASTVTAVPEPGTLTLSLAGAMMLALLARGKRAWARSADLLVRRAVVK